ncbi:replication protein [Bacillus thuringiensis]|nr:replication protein [Bacillus thuringiensis]
MQRLMEFEQSHLIKEKEHEEKKKNHNFIQLYRDNMPELRWLMSHHHFASSLLLFILEHMDNRNALACSYSVFEDYFNKSRSTIYRGIKLLEENGFLNVLKMGTSNVCTVNEDLAWSDSNDKKKFAKYDGKILVSKKENKDYEFQNQFDRFKALRERENIK